MPASPLKLTVLVDDSPHHVVSHPGGAVPQLVFENLLAPLNRSFYAQRHARKVVLVVELTQVHLGGCQKVRVVRTGEVEVVRPVSQCPADRKFSNLAISNRV